MIRNNCLRPAVFLQLYDILTRKCLSQLFHVCIYVLVLAYSTYKNIQINLPTRSV